VPSLLSGAFDLPWWGYLLVAVVLTQVTIAAVTLYLHRNQTHRAIDLHPAVSHFFRLWLWLTTGMRTREWVAVHRKHHAKCETLDDPHSPQVLGINAVLFGGVLLYVEASADPAMVARYGQGTPDDWLERNVYSKHVVAGLTVMGVADVLLFGIVPGALIFIAQIAWIPFWAAGVINGVGHFFGYRNWCTEDASTNIVPFGWWIGGEELHNNHHAYATSARFSNRWYEFDLGWLYIRLLQAVGLARVRHLPPVPHFSPAGSAPDLRTLRAVIANRHHVLASYAKALEHVGAPQQDAWYTMQAMRRELVALWARSMASSEHLVMQLQDWCLRAEASGIAPLVDFSRRLRTYS
jgi:stearoyl-CoA desaturase (Delta-9 desaturase)